MDRPIVRLAYLSLGARPAEALPSVFPARDSPSPAAEKSALADDLLFPVESDFVSHHDFSEGKANRPHELATCTVWIYILRCVAYPTRWTTVDYHKVELHL